MATTVYETETCVAVVAGNLGSLSNDDGNENVISKYNFSFL